MYVLFEGNVAVNIARARKIHLRRQSLWIDFYESGNEKMTFNFKEEQDATIAYDSVIEALRNSDPVCDLQHLKLVLRA